MLSKRHSADTNSSWILGELETTVMDAVWERGESNVHDVGEKVGRALAYTTVMTTLDRLFKKGFLERKKVGRAFYYSARFTRLDFERRKAESFVAGFLGLGEAPREVLVSYLVDAVGEHDGKLLDEMEERIRARRKELSRRSPR